MHRSHKKPEWPTGWGARQRFSAKGERFKTSETITSGFSTDYDAEAERHQNNELNASACKLPHGFIAGHEHLPRRFVGGKDTGPMQEVYFAYEFLLKQALP